MKDRLAIVYRVRNLDCALWSTALRLNLWLMGSREDDTHFDEDYDREDFMRIRMRFWRPTTDVEKFLKFDMGPTAYLEDLE